MIDLARQNVFSVWTELNSFLMGKCRSPLLQYRDLIRTRKELAEALDIIDDELERLKEAE